MCNYKCSERPGGAIHHVHGEYTSSGVHPGIASGFRRFHQGTMDLLRRGPDLLLDPHHKHVHRLAAYVAEFVTGNFPIPSRVTRL
jgi:hypothetical protein